MVTVNDNDDRSEERNLYRLHEDVVDVGDRNPNRRHEYVDLNDEGDDQDAMYESVMLRNVAPKPLDSRTLSMFLQNAAGWRAPRGPSFLNRTEVYVLSRPVQDLFNNGFVARYTRSNHGLKRRVEIDLPEDFFVCEGSFIVGLSMAFQPTGLTHSVSSPETSLEDLDWMNLEVGQAATSVANAATAPGWEAWFLERNLEVGQAVASVALAAGAMGWEARLLGPSLGFRALRRLMGLTSETDLANELPVAAILVFPTPAKQLRTLSIRAFKARIMRVFDVRLQCRSRRSYRVSTPVHHPDYMCRCLAIVEKTDGDEDVRMDRMREGFTGPDSFRYEPGATMRRALNSSRGVAAADFDEEYSMPHGHFEQFLLRCCHSDRGEEEDACFPSGVLPWLPRVNVYVFVNRVEGFETGLYCLVRNQQHLKSGPVADDDRLYHWKEELIPRRSVPLNFVSFFLLRPAAPPDQQELKKSAFVVAMIAPFEDVKKENDVYMYSRQIWEAGFLGEVLAVEAQAQGLSASALNSGDYDWQAAFGIDIADGNVISVYAVGKQGASGIDMAEEEEGDHGHSKGKRAAGKEIMMPGWSYFGEVGTWL